MLLYPVKRVRPEGGNVTDQEITLAFDNRGRLVEVDYNAMLPLMGDVIFSGVESQSGTKFFLHESPPTRQEEH